MSTTTKSRRWLALAITGVEIIASGCASLGGGSSDTSTNPTVQRTRTSQEQSEEALAQAQEAQGKASEQARKAAEAQADVQRAQQALVQAQEKARVEEKKAGELQRQATQQAKEATRILEQTEPQAEQAIRDAGEQLARGEESTSGHVTKATASRLTIIQPDGSSMTFQVVGNTQVMLDGRHSRTTALMPGEQALVDYRLSGTDPIALLVQAASGNPRHATMASASPAAPPKRKPEPAKPGAMKPVAGASASTAGAASSCPPCEAARTGQQRDVAAQSDSGAGP